MAASRFTISETWRSRIPVQTAERLEQYVDYGPAHLTEFERLLLSGDVYQAAALADPKNLAVLGIILAMVAAEFPRYSYGTPPAVKNWRGFLSEPVQVPKSWRERVEELLAEGPLSPLQQPSAQRGEDKILN